MITFKIDADDNIEDKNKGAKNVEISFLCVISPFSVTFSETERSDCLTSTEE